MIDLSRLWLPIAIIVLAALPLINRRLRLIAWRSFWRGLWWGMGPWAMGTTLLLYYLANR